MEADGQSRFHQSRHPASGMAPLLRVKQLSPFRGLNAVELQGISDGTYTDVDV